MRLVYKKEKINKLCNLFWSLLTIQLITSGERAGNEEGMILIKIIQVFVHT